MKELHRELKSPGCMRGRAVLSVAAVLLLLRSNAVTSIGVASLGWWFGRVAGAQLAPAAVLALLCGTLLIYNLDHLRDDVRRSRQSPPGRPRLPAPLRAGALGLSALGLGAAFVLGGVALVRAALPAGVIGLLYGVPLGRWRLRDLPAAKSWLVALAVTQACVFLPLSPSLPGREHLAPALFLLALTALNAHCFDLRDLAVDEQAGTRTWATRLGGAAAHRALVLAACGAAGLVSVAAYLGALPLEAALTLWVAAGSLLWVRPGAPRVRFGLVVDGWLVLPGLLSLLG